MAEERWRAIPNYPGYVVSDEGRVGSCMKSEFKLRKLRKDSDGYVIVDLRKDGRYHTTKVHHLVLSAFVAPRPEGYECDHVNTLRDDNRVSNLRWVSSLENHRNPITLSRAKGGPRRRVVCVDTGEVYETVTAAAKATGACRSHIGAVCMGSEKMTRGLRFRYAEVCHG